MKVVDTKYQSFGLQFAITHHFLPGSAKHSTEFWYNAVIAFAFIKQDIHEDYFGKECSGQAIHILFIQLCDFFPLLVFPCHVHATGDETVTSGSARNVGALYTQAFNNRVVDENDLNPVTIDLVRYEL